MIDKRANWLSPAAMGHLAELPARTAHSARNVPAPAALVLALAIGAAGLAIWVPRWTMVNQFGMVGIDYASFRMAGERFLATGNPYQPYQLAGPYDPYDLALILHPATVPDLYPPPFAIVAVALTVVPWMLWWAIPLGMLAALVIHWRPVPWTWPVIVLALAWPTTAMTLYVGGTNLWVTALVAAALRWRWPGALIALKFTFGPLALIGIRSRGWWVTAGILALASLATAPLWADYITALHNMTAGGIGYSLADLPTVAIPIVAWAGRYDRSSDLVMACSPNPR